MIWSSKGWLYLLAQVSFKEEILNVPILQTDQEEELCLWRFLFFIIQLYEVFCFYIQATMIHTCPLVHVMVIGASV